MAKRDFSLLAVFEGSESVNSYVQIYSYAGARNLNCMVYERDGERGFTFKNKWYALDECIDSDTVIKKV